MTQIGSYGSEDPTKKSKINKDDPLEKKTTLLTEHFQLIITFSNNKGSLVVTFETYDRYRNIVYIFKAHHKYTLKNILREDENWDNVERNQLFRKTYPYTNEVTFQFKRTETPISQRVLDHISKILNHLYKLDFVMNKLIEEVEIIEKTKSSFE